MKHVRAILAAAGLFVATGAIGTAQADDDHNSTTLYTSAISGGRLSCNAVNVSGKSLLIAISIVDGGGNVLSRVPVPNPPTPPGTEVSNDYGLLTDLNEGYCEFQVFGTDDRDDVRAVLVTTRIAFETTAPPNPIPFPAIFTRVLEAH
jgi:hypothetical protein